MQYWINHNGVQSGPVDIDGLKAMSLTSRAYVWHEGMAGWLPITQVPELEGLYETVDGDDGAGSAPQAGDIPSTAPAPAAERNDAVTGQPYVPAAKPAEQPAQQPWQQQPQQPWQQSAAEPQPAPAKRPPTNLVWAIISTLLCCMPAGVVAIVYAVKVMNKYNAGDIEGAERASETGAWWCIASIVLGIMSLPLAYLLPLMGQ